MPSISRWGGSRRWPFRPETRGGESGGGPMPGSPRPAARSAGGPPPASKGDPGDDADMSTSSPPAPDASAAPWPGSQRMLPTVSGAAPATTPPAAPDHLAEAGDGRVTGATPRPGGVDQQLNVLSRVSTQPQRYQVHHTPGQGVHTVSDQDMTTRLRVRCCSRRQTRRSDNRTHVLRPHRRRTKISASLAWSDRPGRVSQPNTRPPSQS